MAIPVKFLTLAGVTIAAALTLGACDRETGAGDRQGAATEVGVVTLKPQRLALTTELVGRTAPYQIAEVRPQVSGIVQKRMFREGADVKAGDSLYQIDPATYEADLASARADLAKAEATVTTMRLRAKRFTELVEIDAVSKQDHDDAVAALKQAEADVAAARAALSRAEINLRYTRVAAPITGRTGKSVVTPGALVTANQQEALTTVQRLDPIYVDVTQSSVELLRLRRDMENGGVKAAGKKARVRLMLEDGTAYTLEGTLEFSDVTVDRSTGSVTLRAIFPNPKHDLLPGMYVRAVVSEGVRDDALLAPQQAVTRDPMGNATALVVGKDGKAEQRTIVTTRAFGDKWLVSGGLAAGDRLIVEGLQRIRPGAPVKGVELTPSPAAARP